jgi:hypothetical protein
MFIILSIWMKHIFFVLFSIVFVGVWFGQDNLVFPDIPNDMPTEIINEENVTTPWTSYCDAKFGSNPTLLQECLSCLAMGSIMTDTACIAIAAVCDDTYALWSEAQASCVVKYDSCISDGWAPERCVCKAIGGISLNTNVPFVGNCIALRGSSSWNTTVVDPTTAFPVLVAGLTRIVMTIILIFCFMAIIVWGILMSMGGADESQHKKGKDLIRHVFIALALLGASGVILRLINPNFFG